MITLQGIVLHSRIKQMQIAAMTMKRSLLGLSDGGLGLTMENLI
jgi:hypothetical protein